MQRTTRSGMILGLLVFCCGGVLFASEVDELRERAKAIRKKASISAEQGKPDQAERLERESAELLEAAERMELKAKGLVKRATVPASTRKCIPSKSGCKTSVPKSKKMREANAPEQEVAEVREQIAGTERELQQIHARHPDIVNSLLNSCPSRETRSRRSSDSPSPCSRRESQDGRDARPRPQADGAGGGNGARRSGSQAAFVGEMHKRQERHGDHGPDVVRELKEEVQRLRAEVKELSQKVEKR